MRLPSWSASNYSCLDYIGRQCWNGGDATPNDHFTACPHRGVTVARRGRVREARSNPTVCARIVSEASVHVGKGSSTPPHTTIWLPVHIAVNPTRPRGTLVRLVGVQLSVAGLYLPPVRKETRVRERVTSAPDDHFISGPHRPVTESRGRRVNNAGNCPTIRVWVVSAAIVEVAVSTTSTFRPRRSFHSQSISSSAGP